MYAVKKQPRIQDWGKINMTFSDFNRTLYHSGKNVVYVAHRDIRKEGDENVFVPCIKGEVLQLYCGGFRPFRVLGNDI